MLNTDTLWQRAARSPLLAYGLLALFGGFVWWNRARDLDLLYATYGLGPMSYTYKAASPQDFALDFPSGAENVSKSAAMLIYPFAYQALGIAPERVWPALLAFEIALMLAVVVALVRTLRPDAPPVVGVLAAALAMASYARNMNFAAFRQPCLWASFYNIADALRLLALVFVLRGRPVLAAALLGGSFMSHPTMGLMGAAFVLCCFVPEPRQLLRCRFLAAALLFFAVAGLWAAYLIGSTPASAGEFPSRLWFDLTRLFGNHWYPLEDGLLGSKHRAAFIPFLSFLALLGYYLRRSSGDRARRATAGMAGMLVLTVLGLALSELDVSPTLTKLALHRANDLVLTVGLAYIVAGLWEEVGSGALWRAALAAAALASPFLSNPGFPLVASVLLVAPGCLKRGGGAGRLWFLLPAAGGVAAVAYYAAAGMAGPATSSAYTGLHWLVTAPALVGGGALALALLARGRVPFLARAVLLVALGVAAARWQAVFRMRHELRVWAQRYKEAQLWARDNTPPDALFMVDPALFHPDSGYGWRDYSRRSSFGSLREWLYLSWHYTSDYSLCQEGRRRLAEFGVFLGRYIGQPSPREAAVRLSAEVRHCYYSATDEWRLDLARRYNIRYFVSRGALGRLPVVFDNVFFVIQAATEPAE